MSSFIGRAREIVEVRRLLTTTRLVTLTGAGGCGKTSLALQVGRDVARQHPGVAAMYWVELASLADAALVPQAVAKALGIVEQSHRALIDALLDYLQEKQWLLILDNCEHLIDACATLANAMLRSCVHLRLLATSREALNVAGEHVYLVPSLAIPNANPELPLLTLAQNESVHLFLARASEAQAHFSLTQQNAAPIAKICRRLDGIPLAIELAAARVNALSVEQIAARLDDSVSFLNRGRRMARPRHQTLRATLDWSYELLTESERVLFRRFAVFAGGWTLEAAEAICAGERIERRQVLDLTIQLVDKSVVLIEESNGITRYRFLEPIRQYAQGRLQAVGETEGLCRNHLAYFLRLAEEAEPFLTSAERQSWLSRLDADLNNFRAALQWTEIIAEQPSGLRLAGALTWFWYFRNLSTEGRQWLARALISPPERAQIATSPHERVYRARALLGIGLLAWQFGDKGRACAELEESLALYRELEDRRGVAHVLTVLGVELSVATFQYVMTRPLLEESVSILRGLVRERQALVDSPSDQAADHIMGSNDQWWLAWSLHRLGEVVHYHDLVGAHSILDEGLALARRIDDPWLISAMLGSLGSVDGKQGDLSTAQREYEEALTLSRGIGINHVVGWALGALGDIARYHNDYRRAAEFYADGLSLYQEISHPDGISWMLFSLGGIALHHGESKRALELFRQSLRLRNDIGHTEGIAEVLDGLAGVAAVNQQPECAARLFGAADALRKSMPDAIQAFYRVPQDPYLPVARAQLAEATFDAAWAAGSALTLEQAIAEAHQVTVAEPKPVPAPTLLQTYPADLTAREVEVLRWLVQGLSDKEIAERLVISVRTVHWHLGIIYGKLGVSSRTAAIHAVRELKIV